MFGLPYLSTVIWLPIVAGVAVLFTGSDAMPMSPAGWGSPVPSGAWRLRWPLYAGFDPKRRGNAVR